jgi:hypothetical protein
MYIWCPFSDHHPYCPALIFNLKRTLTVETLVRSIKNKSEIEDGKAAIIDLFIHWSNIQMPWWYVCWIRNWLCCDRTSSSTINSSIMQMAQRANINLHESYLKSNQVNHSILLRRFSLNHWPADQFCTPLLAMSGVQTKCSACGSPRSQLWRCPHINNMEKTGKD